MIKTFRRHHSNKAIENFLKIKKTYANFFLRNHYLCLENFLPLKPAIYDSILYYIELSSCFL